MKDAHALLAAAFLGLLAIMLNWVYLQNKTAGVESVSLLGVRPGRAVRIGEQFDSEDFVAVPVPRRQADNLKHFAYLYRDLNTVVGIRATKNYQGGELMLRQDYRTPPPELKLAADERLIWVPVDARGFVPALADPGDTITFLLPAQPPAAGIEGIGPFRIGSLGNRLGSLEVMKSHNIAPVAERQVGVVVHVEGDQLEPRAIKLLERVKQVGSQGISVALHQKKQN